MISIENLSFAFNKGEWLFRNMNLTLEPGRTYGLFGMNGAGKTTLLNQISGMLFPAEGTCKVNGVESMKRLPSVMKDIFLVPEQFDLPAVLPDIYTDLHASFYPRFNHHQMKELMASFDLDRNKILSKQSYGQRKKFLISFALAANTEYLLMDEPTNGLDIPSKSRFRSIMSSSDNPDRCTLISTHQVRDLESLIDQVTILHSGSIIFDQSIDSITSHLLFEHADRTSSETLFAEETSEGFQIVRPKLPNTPKTPVDLELLFSCAIQKTDALNRAFQNNEWS